VRWTCCFVFTLVMCSTLTYGDNNRFVQARGSDLVTPDNQRLQLRGNNLGNWLVPEGYMFLLDRGAASPREIERLFNELIGPSAAEDFWHEYRRRYINKKDIHFLRVAGFNSIRIPLHYKFFLTDDSEGFRLLDQVVSWAKEEGLWVILDMHCAPGGQTGTNIDDSWGYPWLFDSQREQDLVVRIWTRIARHYRDEPTVLGYDLLNEPIPPFRQVAKYNGLLEPLYRRMTTAIRGVDNNHVIVVEGAQWDGNFSVFGPPFAKNLVYEFHRYWTTPTQDVIQQYVDFRAKYNVPIWLGESGENNTQWIHSFVRLLEENRIGWCFWPYKKMQDNAGVTSFRKPVYWDEIIAYAEAPGTSAAAEQRLTVRPSLEHSRKALEDLLAHIQFENCTINTDYLQALGLDSTSIKDRTSDPKSARLQTQRTTPLRTIRYRAQSASRLQ
jgi:endoglucanase